MIKNRTCILLISMLIWQSVFSQNVLYFKDFSYCKMSGIDTIKTALLLPKFFVKCFYDQGKITKIETSIKSDFMIDYLTTSISIKEKEGKKYLSLGAGKNRQGYTRGIFQKRVFERDSGFITHDTLIFKHESGKYRRIQFCTNINTDSINFLEMSFEMKKNTKGNLISLSSFNLYKEWFSLSKWAIQVIGGVITPKQDTVLIFNEIKSDVFFNRINITKQNFVDIRTMPISLFWIKQIGLLH